MDRRSPSPAREQNPDKAEAILAGALEVFTTDGYAAASMSRIAAAAKVSKPTLYSYFQDKEGLFVALIQKLTQRNRAMLFDSLSEPMAEVDPEQILRRIAATMLKEFSTNPPLMTLMRLIIGESERFPHLAQTFVREVQKPLLDRLTVYLGSQPQLNLPDPAVAARVFSGTLVHYLIVQKVLNGDKLLPLESDRLVDGLVQILTSTALPRD
ncbi:MAG: TetR/AcrR family transcriptional regulator [Cyanobacteria bacterium P01_A01_bin.135]